MSLSDGRRRRALWLVMAATLCWPLQELTGGELMRNGHHAAQVVALRYIAHLLILVALVLPVRGPRAFRTKRPVLQVVRGLCMFGMPAGYILAVDFASNGWIWTVFWSMPVIALAGAAVLLRERVPFGVWSASLLGLLGAAAIMDPTPAGFVGTGFTFVMGGSFAGYLVLSRVLRKENLLASLLYTGVGAIVPMSLVVGRVWTPLTMADVVPALLTGLLSLAILGCFDAALDLGPVWWVAPFLPAVMIWEVLLAVALHNAPVSHLDILGIAVVALASILALWGVIRRPNPATHVVVPPAAAGDLNHG